MANNYNTLAPFYDFISRIVFRNSIVDAQVSLLKLIPPKSSVLIVGGGTGWVLEELAKIHSCGLIITYVEISSKMIALAQKRNYGQNEIEFINTPVEEFISDTEYDVLFTAFLFDNFRKEKIEIIFTKLNELLRNEGLWLYADFTDEKKKAPLWQKILLKTMYLFFRITTNIETQELIDMQPFFGPEFEKIFTARFYSRFIKAEAYKKSKG